MVYLIGEGRVPLQLNLPVQQRFGGQLCKRFWHSCWAGIEHTRLNGIVIIKTLMARCDPYY